MIDASRRLADFPESGRSVPEFADPALRELLVSNYRMLYRVGEAVVTIATVIHQKQSIEEAIARRTPSRGA